MTGAKSTIVKLCNGLALVVLLATLVGLPLAVEMDVPLTRLGGQAVLARVSDAVAVRTRISLSEHLPLTLDSGLVSPAAADVARGYGLMRLQIDEPELTLDLSRSAVPDAVAAVESETALIARIGGFKSGALRLRRGKLTIISSTGTRHLIKDINATIAAVRLGQFKLSGTGRYNGQVLSLDASWSAPVARDDAPVPLHLVLRSGVIEATFDGLLGSKGKSTLSGRAELRVPNLGKLFAWTGLGGDIGERIRSIQVAGPLVWTPTQMAFAPATVDVDGNRAVGALTLRHSGARPAIDATLAFHDLRIPAFKGADNDNKRDISAALPSSRLLAVFDADLRLSAARIIAPGIDIGRGAVTIALNRGRLEADLMGLELESGSAEGRFTLDVNKPAAEAGLKFKAKSVDIGHILTSIGMLRAGAVQGKANISFDGQANGVDLSTAISRLSGRGDIIFTQAGLIALDISALLASARTAAVVSWPIAGKGTTPVEKLSCKFRLLNGAVTIEKLQARTGERAVFGAGRIDVPGRLLDVSMGEGPAASGEAPITGIAHLSMSGTWDNPAIRLVQPSPGPAMEAAPGN